MSPKSSSPAIGRGSARASPTMTLWSLASPWITWRRSRGSAGTTSRSKRSSSARRRARAARGRPRARAARACAPARARSHGKSRRAAECVKSASARSISPSMRPSAVSVSRERGRALASVAPESQLSIHTSRGDPSGPGASPSASPARVGTTRGSGRPGARASRWASAAHCIATSVRSRAGCIAFSTNERPSDAVRRKLSSNSPGSARAQADEPVERGGEAGGVPLRNRPLGAAFGQHGRDLSLDGAPRPRGRATLSAV